MLNAVFVLQAANYLIHQGVEGFGFETDNIEPVSKFWYGQK